MKQILSDWGLQGLAVIGAFLAPLYVYVLYISLLVIADLITGLLKANKLKENKRSFWDTIESRKLFSTLAKWMLYVLAILIGQGATEIFISEVDLPKIILAGIAFIEVKSIDENMKEVLGYSILGKVVKIFSRTK